MDDQITIPLIFKQLMSANDKALIGLVRMVQSLLNSINRRASP